MLKIDNFPHTEDETRDSEIHDTVKRQIKLKIQTHQLDLVFMTMIRQEQYIIFGKWAQLPFGNDPNGKHRKNKCHTAYYKMLQGKVILHHIVTECTRESLFSGCNMTKFL